MKNIQRTTKVVSVSLPVRVAAKLEQGRSRRGQSRSAYISALIDKQAEDQRWESVYGKGAVTARRLNITSEMDIDRIIHEA